MSWFIFPKSNPQSRYRLFCFHYAGGNAQIFRNWPKSLPSNVEVVLVQLPGRGSRMNDTPFTHLSPLIEAVARAVRPYLDKPFAFFGHSMGALISFELARHLRRLRQPEPIKLFISGRPAPQVPDEDPPTYNLPEQEFLAELRRLNGTPKEALDHPELMQLLIPIIRADFSICETYVYTDEPPLGCPITAYGGLQDDEIPREDLEAWREQTASSFTLQMFFGDHFFIHSTQERLLNALHKELLQLVRNVITAPPAGVM